MLSTKRAASRLGVSEQTVRNMHKTARIYGEQRGRGYYFPDTQIIRRNANGQSRVVDGLSTVLAAFDEPADAWIWLNTATERLATTTKVKETPLSALRYDRVQSVHALI